MAPRYLNVATSPSLLSFNQDGHRRWVTGNFHNFGVFFLNRADIPVEVFVGEDVFAATAKEVSCQRRLNGTNSSIVGLLAGLHSRHHRSHTPDHSTTIPNQPGNLAIFTVSHIFHKQWIQSDADPPSVVETRGPIFKTS